MVNKKNKIRKTYLNVPLIIYFKHISLRHGARCTKGVINKGKYYYEATVTDEGLCRVGWSTWDASHDLGTDRMGFGFGGTGKKSNNKQFDTYGEVFNIKNR
jgi:ATP-dependent RNA helicase DDX1